MAETVDISMSQLDEAIARYNKILVSEPYSNLGWIDDLRAQMRDAELTSGGRLLCPFLRPHFLTRRQYETLVKAGEKILSAAERLQGLVLESPHLMTRLELLPAEKMLAAIDPGYKYLDVISRLDWQVSADALHLVQHNADSPSGMAWADTLADIFYHAPPLKEFRSKQKLSKVGGKGYLLTALMTAWKQFGGKGKPRIGVLEFRSGLSSAPTEFSLFRDYFHKEGIQVEIVSPEQLEFKNGVLRRGGFEIDLIYRRVSVQEFLQRFDLSHPLVQSYRAGAVCLVNSFRSELAHKRAFFGLLTDETVTAKFPIAERKAIQAHVPWTRLVTPGKTTYRDQTIDLMEFIRANQEKLLLKPNDEYSGEGSFFGWEMDERGWDRALRQTSRSPYVVQERIEPTRIEFPLETYGPVEFKQMRVDLHVHGYLGKVLSCSSWLSSGQPGGFSAASGLAPTYILEPKR